ncbi:ubiquitin-like superfamily protein isoform X2 [Tasmannia lanceolata]|uniref:ubiquitin-like superfamily protein isoform X2 n=1 Tax=Tasmannia lanceolata TaxID=3420 RepID=UPI004062AF40
MADESSVEGTSTSSIINDGSSESIVEVNVKTLDSQIYTFRVNKNMPVSSFKEKIASTIGLPVGQQRLIFRGKVLKDDHILSEYQLEDGHTLHLVARQPIQSQTPTGTNSAETDGNNDNRGSDSTAGVPRNRIGQVSHSVVLGTFNVGEQGEGMVPDLSRMIGSILNSVGIGNLAAAGGAGNMSSTTASGATNQPPQGVATEGTLGNTGSRSQTVNGVQPGQAFINQPFQSVHQSLLFPLTGSIAVPSHPMVIPDSLTTIAEFINRMELVLSPNGHQSSPSPPNPDIPSPNVQRLPTPEVLVSVIRRAQELLNDHAGAALSNIADRLERDGPTVDPVMRGQIQVEAMQVGVAMQHLGALLLELGRTILMLRMGQSPAESLVNAGPAVYISPSGPNPIMVQPFPLQTSSLFGVPSAGPQANAGMSGSVGLRDVTRNINIHIHAGTSGAPGLASVGSRANTGEATNAGQPPNQASVNGTRSVDSASSHILPVRRVVAVAQGSRPAVPPGVQPSMGSSVLEPTGVTAEVYSHITSDDDIIPDGHLSSSTFQTADLLHRGPLESAFEDSSIRSSLGDDDGTHQLESVTADGSVKTRETSTSSTGDSLNCQYDPLTADKPQQSSKDQEQSGSGKSVPLGLGLGGLQPKRSKRVKSQGKDVGTSDTPAINQNQPLIAVGQQLLQSLSSRSSNTNRNDANGLSMQLPPVFSQIVDSLPLGGQGTNGQFDAATMMSQVLQSPALNSLLAGVSEQAGVGSPAGLRNILEQVTQSPSIRSTLNQIAQQVEGQGGNLGNMFSGLGRGQGGTDFSSMIQQMMPVVSQALGRVSPAPLVDVLQSDPQPPCDDSRPGIDDEVVDINSQIDVHEIAQSIEHHESPDTVFRMVVENASHLYGEGTTTENLVEQICSSDSLANDFMEMLKRDIQRRLQSESRSASDKS